MTVKTAALDSAASSEAIRRSKLPGLRLLPLIRLRRDRRIHEERRHQALLQILTYAFGVDDYRIIGGQARDYLETDEGWIIERGDDRWHVSFPCYPRAPSWPRDLDKIPR